MRGKNSGSTRARSYHTRSRSGIRRRLASFSSGTEHLAPRDDGVPRKPYAWLAFFVVLSIVIITLWFREDHAGPLHSTRTAIHTVAVPLEAVGTWTTSPVRNFFDWAGDLGVTRSELQEISAQNEYLRMRVSELEEINLANERLTDLLSAVPDGTDEDAVLPAAVIGLPRDNYQEMIILNRGTRQGVDLAMPVVTEQGLLGVTVVVGPNYSKVRLISDPQSGVAALIQRGRQEGIARGSLAGDLVLDFVSVDADVRPGDVVVTSGIGGVYPKGLVIGEVLRAHSEGAALYQTVIIRSTNNMDIPEEVLILLEAPPSTDNLPQPDLQATGIESR